MRAVLRRLRWFFLPGWGTTGSPSLEQDWRLRGAFDDVGGARDVFDRVRGREQVLGSEVGGLLPFGAMLSRDDEVLFVYASSRIGIEDARKTIERVAHAAGLGVDLRVSHWDRHVKDWRQVDPPLSGLDRELDEARAREATRHETRELSYVVIWLDRVRVEGLILDFAHRRGLRCVVENERRLFNVYLTLSVSGPASMLDEFVDYARSVVASHGAPMDAPVGGG